MAAALMTGFDEVYSLPDARGYFSALRPYEYQSPHHAQRLFKGLLEELGPGPHTVLDLCCSYGVNAALLTCAVTLDELYERYTSPAVARLGTDELIGLDRAFYAERRLPGAVRVVGVDASRPAVDYALAAGLLAEGYAENLETEGAEPSKGLLRAAAGASLITVTGGSSFLTPRTYGPLAAASDGRAAVASAVVRHHDYGPVAAALRSYGLTDRRSQATYRHRRFTDEAERARVVAAVLARGEDPAGRESEGWIHTWMHIARPHR
ncbi:hypothetical protein ACQKM2_03605 [Streptomyces sp. NPDC004126]|uniref:hypothetical protein n=1 Tax=Streptomyces sp. NPDC004126 TaxID=3390695 RepID=UPI003D04C7E0